MSSVWSFEGLGQVMAWIAIALAAFLVLQLSIRRRK
jgi:hypothetical protein